MPRLICPTQVSGVDALRLLHEDRSQVLKGLLGSGDELSDRSGQDEPGGLQVAQKRCSTSGLLATRTRAVSVSRPNHREVRRDGGDRGVVVARQRWSLVVAARLSAFDAATAGLKLIR